VSMIIMEPITGFPVLLLYELSTKLDQNRWLEGDASYDFELFHTTII
jgi:hypothetical protein